MKMENTEKQRLKNGKLPIQNVSASTVIKELHKALTNLLQAADDEGWVNDDTGKDWEEQSQARKALANTPREYLR